MTIGLVMQGWRPETWRTALGQLDPGRKVEIYPELTNPSEIRYTLAWLPPENAFRDMPNLTAIFSLGAGVDAILQDASIPAEIPIIRVVVPDLTKRMTEYVVWQVLSHHRQERLLREMQQAKDWQPISQCAAGSVRVGIMGLGTLGQDAAAKLVQLGFSVSGWSQSPKSLPGVESYAGHSELSSFLNTTDILVCLLPHTPETEGILNLNVLKQLAKDGPLGGPVLINAGRGKLQVGEDILTALDTGALQAATLDVFETEPLPGTSPFWDHPRVTVTPHIAADSEPSVIAEYVVKQIKAHEAGAPFDNVVDRSRGY